jgi:hypothetical protein
MSQMMAVEAIKVIPALLWVAFAVLVYLTLRRAIVPQLGRLSSLKTPVVELSFAEQLLDKAAASKRHHLQACDNGARLLWTKLRMMSRPLVTA